MPAYSHAQDSLRDVDKQKDVRWTDLKKNKSKTVWREGVIKESSWQKFKEKSNNVLKVCILWVCYKTLTIIFKEWTSHGKMKKNVRD